MCAARGIGGLRKQCQTVLADHFHFCARHRLAGRDGLHEYILRAVERALHENAKVGHQDETKVFSFGWLGLLFALGGAFGLAFIRVGWLFIIFFHCLTIKLRVIALHTQQKNAAFVGAILLQVIAEVQRFIMRLALLQTRQRNFFLEALGEIFHAERAHELRLVEIAFRLRDEMLQLRGQHAANVHTYAG